MIVHCTMSCSEAMNSRISFVTIRIEHSEKEMRLREDLKHGMMVGTAECAVELRDTFLPASVQKGIPQQLKIHKDVDPSDRIRKAAAMCDVDMFFCKQSKRISKSVKTNRDLPV